MGKCQFFMLISLKEVEGARCFCLFICLFLFHIFLVGLITDDGCGLAFWNFIHEFQMEN